MTTKTKDEFDAISDALIADGIEFFFMAKVKDGMRVLSSSRGEIIIKMIACTIMDARENDRKLYKQFVSAYKESGISFIDRVFNFDGVLWHIVMFLAGVFVTMLIV